MAQPKDARLTQELAREVCQRTASAATIEGSIASLGSQYVLGLKAVKQVPVTLERSAQVEELFHRADGVPTRATLAAAG